MLGAVLLRLRSAKLPPWGPVTVQLLTPAEAAAHTKNANPRPGRAP